LREKKILVVDDNTSITSTFKIILEKQNYIVHTSSSGQEALSLADTRYDLVILDIKLPDMMGDRVAKAFTERKMTDNIVLITGYPELEECIQILGVGIQEILIKPISPEELLRVAREAFYEENETPDVGFEARHAIKET
jgi:DNA-binding response OmpR family regulator